MKKKIGRFIELIIMIMVVTIMAIFATVCSKSIDNVKQSIVSAMNKCNWFLNPHCWHIINGSKRKVRSHKDPPCHRNPDSAFILNERIYSGVKTIWLEECCKCGKIRKEYGVDINIERAQKLPAEEDKPLNI